MFGFGNFSKAFFAAPTQSVEVVRWRGDVHHLSELAFMLISEGLQPNFLQGAVSYDPCCISRGRLANQGSMLSLDSQNSYPKGPST